MTYNATVIDYRYRWKSYHCASHDEQGDAEINDQAGNIDKCGQKRRGRRQKHFRDFFKSTFCERAMF